MTLRLGSLKAPKGSTRNRKRLGRGTGSTLGKTCGKGHKGHKARSGYKRRAHREGGQMPLYRKLPKRGFKNPNRVEFEAINVGRLAQLDTPEITMEILHTGRLLATRRAKYKILGQGDFARACVVHAHAFSKSAREKIEAAGGRCEVIA
jgi:large subunit ribosomal protein L15